MTDGWVASDATSHVLTDKSFTPTSLVSVAIAVDNRDEFDNEYRSIVREKCKEYGIPFERPVIKDDIINKYVAEWERTKARRDIVETLLLEIDTLSNVHFTETTLGEKGDEVVPAYLTEPEERRLMAPRELRDKISPYYNLVSIWDYFNRIDEHFQHRNVMVDDFDGMESLLWREIGQKSNKFRVVPKGDRIYPLLSLADLTMEYIKQEVDNWSDDKIFEHLTKVAPGEEAYVKSHSLDSTEELQTMAPLSNKPADTEVHYPHPVIFIDTGEWHQKEVKTLDVYDVLCEYANKKGGCLKFLDERTDREYMKKNDIIVCIDEGGTEQYERYSELNDHRSVEIKSVREAMDDFLEDIRNGERT